MEAAERPVPASTERPAEIAEKPSGPVAAVLLAAGIGALMLGILTVWAEASVGFKDSLAYSDRVGPLAGKTIWAVVAFFVSWGALTVGLRGRRVDLAKVTVISLVLLGLGYLGTFSSFFRLFEAE
jgi:hypothetical protein